MRIIIIIGLAVALAIFVAACEEDSAPAPVTVQRVDTLAPVKSPCEDADAERVTLSLSKTLLAPQWLYDRVHNDLATIRTTYADSFPGVHSIHLSNPGYFDAFIDEAILDLSDSTSRRLLDSLCSVYDITVTPFQFIGGWYIFESSRRYYTPLMMIPFTTVPGILIMENGEVFFDGQDLYVLREGQNIKYFFMVGRGDCPAGCFQHQYTYFISEGGKCRLVEQTAFTHSSDWVEPVWIDTMQMANCARTPHVNWHSNEGWTYNAVPSCGIPPAPQ